MAISLDNGSNGAPGLKLRNKGDACTVAVCHVQLVPWLEFGTDKPKLDKNGKPRQQELLRVLVLEAGNAVKTDNGEDVPVAVGEELSLYLAGGKRWDYIQAKKAAGGLNVGDTMRICYERDEKSKQAGAQPRKVWVFSIAHGSPIVAKCEAVYSRMKAAGDKPATQLSGPDEPSDEIPF